MSDEVTFVNPDPSKVIFVDRVDDVPTPKYRPFGKSRCMQCDHWVWLGSGPYKLVLSGGATPVCIPCGTKMQPMVLHSFHESE